MSDNKRKYIRIPHTAAMHLRDGETGEGLLYFDFKNLSEGGAFIESELLLEEGMQFDIKFELDKGEFLEALAEVVWVTRDEKNLGPEGALGMGIEFREMKESDLERIQDFINQQTAS